MAAEHTAGQRADAVFESRMQEARDLIEQSAMMAEQAGVAAVKILSLIADYKSGAQPATIMHQISKGYTDEQLKLIAAWFAAQKPAK